MNDSNDETRTTRGHQTIGAATLSGRGSLRATLSVGVSLAFWQVQAATFFARCCGDLETLTTPYDAPDIEDVRARHRAYTTGAIFSSVAFLEATINEFFGGSSHSTNQMNETFSPQELDRARSAWTHFLSGRPTFRTVDKYQLALKLTHGAPFSEKLSTTPPPVGSFPDIQNLTTLRNSLIHYKPLWQIDQAHEDKEVSRLKSMLRARFSSSMNPFVDPRSHFLEVYLGHACAAWAIRTSLAFTDDFFSRLGLPAPYEHMRSKLAV